MTGDRERFTCGKCGRTFFYWVLAASSHPKVKCYFCATEAFPRGAPPAAPEPAPPPKPAPAPASPAPAPAG